MKKETIIGGFILAGGYVLAKKAFEVGMIVGGVLNNSAEEEEETYVKPSKLNKIYNNGDVLFDTREEADLVLGTLKTYIERYGRCTVADFYDLVGIENYFYAAKFGWTSLEKATLIREGVAAYKIKFPSPQMFN